MCLIVFSWQPERRQPLLLLANRDEVHARSSAPLAQWSDQPSVYAGRDLEAGGSWLGIAEQGRFAALTNIRDMSLPLGEQSRGALVSDYLASEQSPQAYLQDIAAKTNQYSGFNLLVGDLNSIWYLNSTQSRPLRLTPGVYGLCNGSLFAERLDAQDHTLFELMQDERRAEDDQLPDTGVGLSMERMLSSIFIRGESYGTRAISLLRRFDDGWTSLDERSYSANGRYLGHARVELPKVERAL